ncbi:cobalt ECF transporter T component CbiQ [Dongia mobilis]|uniref:cobalt ECF transporter T component CbiQ n=1 Tax=Dongia sp. TaxID=1977262 RepID=UPI0026F1CA9B
MRLIDRNAQTNRWRQIAAIEKVVLSLGMIVLGLCSASWLVQGLILATMLLLLRFGAGVGLADILKSASVPLLFILASTLAQIVTLDVNHMMPVIGLSPASINAAAFVGLRSLACIGALLFLALTTPLTDLLRLLRRLGLGAEVSDVALMMFRFVWLTLDCLERGRQSQANRLGYGGYRRSLQSIGMLLANLLPRVLGRAQRLEAGLASRGYHGELRFIVRERPLSAGRLLAVSLLLLSIAALGRIAG